jgi:hypothetical protein
MGKVLSETQIAQYRRGGFVFSIEVQGGPTHGESGGGSGGGI